MQINNMYPLLVVPDVAAVREWYVRHLGLTVVVETDWFIYLADGQPPRFGLAFMREGLDFIHPLFRTALTGDAVIVTIEVPDAQAAWEEVRATGVEPDLPLADEPWGQRHFMLRDPAGVWVDVVQQIPPDPGFLDTLTQRQFTDLAHRSGDPAAGNHA